MTSTPPTGPLQSAKIRLNAALGTLDQSAWHFQFQPPALFAVRIWPQVAVDTLIVLGPNVVMARRDMPDQGEVWSAQGTVERMVRAIVALGTPEKAR